MPCANCGQSSWVTIGAKQYCTNCGSLQRGNTIVGAANAVSGPTEVVKPSVDAVAPSTTPAPAPRPIAKPVSAQSLHTGTALASGGILDLREKKPAAPVSTASAAPTRPAGFTDIASRPKPATAAPQVAAEPTPAPIVTPEPVPQPVAPQPTVEPVVNEPVAQPTSTVASIFQSATQTDVVAPASTPAPVTTPEPEPIPEPEPVPPVAAAPQPTLSELAASLSSPAEAVAEKQQAANLKKPASIVAAGLAVVIMGGYIWMNNYSNLSIRTASSRAGIVASLPHYTPSGYKLNGPINYGTGFVSFNLKSGSDKAITVTQRKTNWDSASLLQLFVTPKAKDYVAVDTQGLKVYVYGDHQATWVNHGLQYVVQADASVSKDQLVKMAESL